MKIPNVQGDRPKTGEITRDTLWYYFQRINAARQWIMPGYPFVSTHGGEERLRDYLIPENADDAEDLKRELAVIELYSWFLDSLHFLPKLNESTGYYDFRYPKVVDDRKEFCMLDKLAREDALDIYEGDKIEKEHNSGKVNE